MSLKSKAALIFLCTFIVCGATSYAVQQFVVLPSFTALEQSEAQRDLERAVEAIKREVHHLNTFCWDWSAWDDTYAFMVTRSKKYVESNLVLGTFADNGINLIYFVDRGGEVIWGKIYDLETEKPIKLTGFQKGTFQGNHPLIPQQKETEELSQISVSGIVATEKGPMLVAARPILTSEDEEPRRGTLIMGRFLDDDLVKTLADQSKVVFSIHPAGSDPSHETKREIHGSRNSKSPYLFEKQGPSYLLVSTKLPDVEGNKTYLITAKISRAISAKGYDTTRYAVISGFVSMLLVLITMLFVLQRTILRPIIELKNHASSIGKTGNLSARVSIGRQDEIGSLGFEFDRMMEKLEKQTDKLTELNEEMKKDIARRIQAEEEKARLETHLQQAEKMEAIATLAGGVAHEFNNALMGIMGNIELLKMNSPEDEGGNKYFEAMKGSGHRMSRLTDQLLAYARGGKYQARDLKLDDFVVTETLPILQHDISPTVRVETHFPKDISHIKADYTQIQMVLSAILANSNEAIEDEGLIKITAGNEDLGEDFTKQHHGLKPGSYVCLTVEDNGKGMDEEQREKVFDPFFTTKFQGRGMGMAAVYGIVKNHDGWISVDSELGKGTTVQIYLPAISAEGKAQGAKTVKQPELELAIGEGTILMIEDEEVVIEVTQAMLESLGYRVMVAKTGKDAINITKTFDGQIDLALLDIKLPDMEGGKVYPLIVKARPDLKVIVFSGYAIDGPARKILDAGAEDFIQKPFSLETLSEKMKQVLEGK